MRKIFPKNFAWHFPKSRKEEAEFGKGRKGIPVCKFCDAVYWKKSWHHSINDFEGIDKEKDIKFIICPACQMIEDNKYEGEVIIENVPVEKREKLENLINKFGENAFDRDPMDRIISIQTIAKGMIRVLTTENQMAQQLVKKIGKTFKGKVSFLHSKRESTLRAKIILQ